MAVTYMDLKSKRTEAVAPRTLFGTSIEMNDGKPNVNEQEIEKANKSIKKQDKTTAYRPPSADEKLRLMKEAIERQDLKVKFAEGRLKNRQNDALLFNINNEPASETSRTGFHKVTGVYESERTYSPYRTDIKHHSRDIAMAEEFNRLGLDDKCDYNYQRCRPRVKLGSYQGVGNILTTGNLFAYKGKKISSTSSPTHGKLRGELSSTSSRSSASSIPPNIKHTYGEELCSRIKANEIKETMTADAKSASSSAKLSPEPERNPMYDALGHALRQDIFNGVPHNKMRSLNTDSYTLEVHSKSNNAYPPEFAVQKNMDSKWAEDCVIRSRVMKEWNQMMLEKQAKGTD
ncbi:uncharacterized protein LOC117120576 [Anneissia japonica]|uniref:uncharacterized protein LOC117120576 n=1 Tax=Anneissia japonica TaxID=1529436 RepID=UPI0014255EDA|nr:uncharacterized protein LOC117120576 [Anneissia japonica]